MWLITKDNLADPEDKAGTNSNAVGLGSSNYRKDVLLPYRFRMLDDDGAVYYEGFCSRESFQPLDDFGMPNAGCTMIEYWNNENHKWEVL